MASSEKAGALKDAFVNAIADELGGEAMAEAGAMENAKLAGKLGLPVGDQAKVTVMLDTGMEYGAPYGVIDGRNDGDDGFRINRGGMNYRMGRHDSNMYPIEGKGVGADGHRNLTQQEHKKYSKQLNDFLDNERRLGYL